MRRLVLISFLILLLVGCASEKQPKGVLSEDKMVEVLIDIQLTEGIAGAMPISYDSSQVLYRLLERDVFLKHAVVDSVFTKSMIYYLQYPGKIDAIYARVVDSLSLRQSTENALDQTGN
ncbi:MAG: PBP1b-binding outer membrane lipoprotein LpoB [Algoriphagus sp.]|mgnify:CR=1 FL=1